MDLPSILLAAIVFLTSTAICVLLFERLGFGAILGFIVAGVIIGPHTPGPVPVHAVDELQSIAELGVVLFLFVVGLENRPERIWAMRRLIFGLGSAQMVVTAALLAGYFYFFASVRPETAIIVGLAFAMSSTAIVMATLGGRGDLATEHGRTCFAILMAQDLWIVPIMALVPILAHETGPAAGAHSFWEKVALALGVIGGIFVVGRFLMPAALGYCAKARQMDAFGVILFLAVLAAAWAVDAAGISMTLGAFLLGMLLSASDLRHQIEATVAPFKSLLMGLFFIAVGMSIDVSALLRDWASLVVHVPIILALKGAVLIGLALAFGISRPAAVRTGFYLSQVGEFAFVLLGAAAAAGLIDGEELTLAMLVVAVSMVATPLMVKAGDQLASRLRGVPAAPEADAAAGLDRHVVVVGFEEVGQLIVLMLEKSNIPHVAFDRDLAVVRRGRKAGHDVHFGDMYNPPTRDSAGLARAAAVYVTSWDVQRAKDLAITLHRLYPQLNVYVRVRSLSEQDALVAEGIKHAGTGYIESTLNRGGKLLKDLGVSEDAVAELVESLQRDDYALIRTEAV